MKNFNYEVDVNQVLGENSKFWTACGTDSLYPQLFRESGSYLMNRMKGKDTCRFLRNHHTLSSMIKDGFENAGGDVYSEDEQGNPIYHFEKINTILKKYLEFGMKPILELDFLPDELSQKVERGGEEEGLYYNRSYPKDWTKWQNLLRAFMQNLKDAFGVIELRTWYFEVWNEADGWPVADWPQFHRLYDVFADAVLGIDEKLRIGGPGSFKQDFLHDFLEHVVNGTNYVTGKRGTRIDFISHHIYGMSGSWLRKYPLVMPTVQRFNHEIMWLSRLIGSYPELADVEFHLNEWGVCSHYEKQVADYPALEIRNSEFSACFFVKLVDCIQHIRFAYGFNVDLMLYWGFCLEDSLDKIFAGNRDLTTAGHIAKPILTAFEMLALMGNQLIQVKDVQTGGPLGCMATRQKDAIQLMVYHFNEYEEYEESTEGTVALNGLEDGKYQIRCICLDKDHHNTYRTWQALGSPEKPDREVMQQIAAAGELTWDYEMTAEVSQGRMEWKEMLPVQCIKYIEVRPLQI